MVRLSAGFYCRVRRDSKGNMCDEVEAIVEFEVGIVWRPLVTACPEMLERLTQPPTDRPAPPKEQLVKLHDHDVHDQHSEIRIRDTAETIRTYTEEFVGVVKPVTLPELVRSDQQPHGIEVHFLFAPHQIHKLHEEILALELPALVRATLPAPATPGLEQVPLVFLEEVLSNALRGATDHGGGRSVPDFKEEASSVVTDRHQCLITVCSQEPVHPAHALHYGRVAPLPQLPRAVP